MARCTRRREKRSSWSSARSHDGRTERSSKRTCSTTRSGSSDKSAFSDETHADDAVLAKVRSTPLRGKPIKGLKGNDNGQHLPGDLLWSWQPDERADGELVHRGMAAHRGGDRSAARDPVDLRALVRTGNGRDHQHRTPN